MPRPTAVRAPATRDQADAYRFGLRRLEAALVRGDPVPLHEQIRSQRRAAVAGVALGMLGLCAAALYAVLVPPPDWRTQAVVVAEDSRALYAVAGDPQRLVPVENLAAARLVLAAMGRGDAMAATPKPIPDRTLADARRTGAVAVPGAAGVEPETTIVPSWAICDQVDTDGAPAGTTVIGGTTPVAPTGDGDGVLVAAPDDETWLITGGRRFRVDVGDGALMAAYGLARVVPRAVNPAVLALVPAGPELATPVVPDRGDPAPAGLPGRVGDVLVTRTAGVAKYFVVLSDGVQQVPEAAADLLRVASGARAPREVDADVPGRAKVRNELDVAGWPAAAPRLLEPDRSPVTCWTWSATGDPDGQVWLGAALPVPAGTTPVPLAQGDGPGERVDAVWVGAGGAVRLVGGVDEGDGGKVGDPAEEGGRASDSADDTDAAEETSGGRPESPAGRSGSDSEDSSGGSSADRSEDSDAERSDEDAAGAGSSAGSGSATDRGDRSDTDRDSPADSSVGNLLGSPAADVPGATGADGQVWLVSNSGIAYPVVDDVTAAALGVTTAEPAPAALLAMLPTGPALDLAAATDVVRTLR